MKRLLPLLGGLAALALILAWAFRQPPEPVGPQLLAHYAEYPRLVKAAWTGDRPLAGVVARDLTAGPEGESADVATLTAQDAVGGALGFIGFAEDAEELAEAVAAASAGCGSCHATLEVMPPPRPRWAHASAGEWLAWGLVWGDDTPPTAGAEPLDQVEGAYAVKRSSDTGDATPEQAHLTRVGQAWAACASCHQSETQLPQH
ncbi:MAG: hypothetical protein KC912_02960 [Proteobacteria bacterium]|nr:hypothetical protein [Pseudomonadota bacterium]